LWAGTSTGKIYNIQLNTDFLNKREGNQFKAVPSECITKGRINRMISTNDQLWLIDEGGLGIITSNKLKWPPGHHDTLTIIKWEHMGKTFIISGDKEGYIQIWNTQTVSVVSSALIKEPQSVPALSICMVGHNLICIGSVKEIFLLALVITPEGNISIHHTHCIESPSTIKHLAFTDDLLWTGSNTELSVWELNVNDNIKEIIPSKKRVIQNGDITALCSVNTLEYPEMWVSSKFKSVLIWEKFHCKEELRGSIGMDIILAVSSGMIMTCSSDMSDHYFRFWFYITPNK